MAIRKEAIVFVYFGVHPVPAGRLITIIDGRDIRSEFAYGTKYLEREEAIPVDPVMLPLPVRGGRNVFTTPPDFGMFNGIRDAGPDRWGRFLLDKRFPAVTLDDFDYIMAAGADRSGCLGFGYAPESGPGVWDLRGFRSHPERILNLDEVIRGIEAQEDNTDPNFLALLEYGSSMGGARPKGSVTWGEEICLAKFTVKGDAYDIARVEYATMLMARDSGINIPEVDVADVGGKSVYLIRRFDRKRTPEGVERYHFCSALTATGMHEADYGSYSYDEIAMAIARFSDEPDRDREELFRRLAFNVFVTNSDDHMRNHGFLHTGKGRWRLSPAYDIVPVPQTGETYSQALKFGRFGKESSLANLEEAARMFGVRKGTSSEILDRVREVAREWQSRFSAAGVSDSDIAKLSGCFRDELLRR